MKVVFSMLAVFCLSTCIADIKDNQRNPKNSGAGTIRVDVKNNTFSKDSFNTAEDQRVLKDIRDQLKGGWFSKKHENVSIKVNNGNVVLSGKVDSQDEKQKVEKDVRNVKGVKNVDNQITVNEKNTSDNTVTNQNKEITKAKKEFPQDTFTTPADELLNTKIRQQVSLGYFWNSYKTIKLATDKGVVTVEGDVKNAEEAQKLINEIKKIEGVKSVNSKLQFKE